MVKYLLYFVITFVIFMLIDLVWLGVVAKNFYRQQLGFIMTDDVNWVAAIVFYIVFIVGALYFVIVPAIEKGSWTYALTSGMIYGFVTYATYDLTNLATLKDWPLKITIIDLIWGTSLSTMTSVFSYLAITKFIK